MEVLTSLRLVRLAHGEHGGIGLDNLAVREFSAAQAVEMQHVADWVRRQWFIHHGGTSAEVALDMSSPGARLGDRFN